MRNIIFKVEIFIKEIRLKEFFCEKLENTSETILDNFGLNQLEHQQKMKTFMHSKLTYTSLREVFDSWQKTVKRHIVVQTCYYLPLLKKQTTYMSFLRTIITNYLAENYTKSYYKTNTAVINNINKEAKYIAEHLHLDDRV